MFKEGRLPVKFPLEELAWVVTIRPTQPIYGLTGFGQPWLAGQIFPPSGFCKLSLLEHYHAPWFRYSQGAFTLQQQG